MVIFNSYVKLPEGTYLRLCLEITLGLHDWTHLNHPIQIKGVYMYIWLVVYTYPSEKI